MSKKLNAKGFTLLESLLALMVTSLVFLLIGLVLQTLLEVEGYMSGAKQNIEWHIFLNQIEYDGKDKKLTKVTSYEVSLEEAENLDLITYTQVGSKIRWQQNRKGYAPMLNKVKQVNFRKIESGLLIESEFTNGQKLEGMILLEEK